MSCLLILPGRGLLTEPKLVDWLQLRSIYIRQSVGAKMRGKASSLQLQQFFGNVNQLAGMPAFHSWQSQDDDIGL